MARFVSRAAASLGTILVLWACFPSAVHATENETFGISPFPERVDNVVRRTFAIPLNRGSAFEDAVRVYNRSDQPIELLVYPADARAALDGTISVGLRGSTPPGVGSWIKLSRSSVALEGRASAVVRFRVTVRSTKPTPDLAAIVAENAAPSARPGLSRRLDIVLRTTPPGSPTTSTKVRAFTFRSGWTIVAVGVLIAAGVLVWLVRRRARRSRDDVPPEPARAGTEDDTPDASRPVLHRFGRADTDPKLTAFGTQETESRLRRPPRRRPIEPDDRPLLDEVAFIEDDDFDADDTDEVELPPRPKVMRRPAKPAPRKPTPPKKTPPPTGKLDYIPLEDL